MKLLKTLYAKAFVTCLALAVVANKSIASVLFPSPVLLGGVIFALTAYMSSNLSFQFYHVPAMAASLFGAQRRAVCLSFMDGLGFFLSAPAWAATGMLVKALGDNYGWTGAWLMLATLFGGGSMLMLKQLPNIMMMTEKKKK